MHKEKLSGPLGRAMVDYSGKIVSANQPFKF
jgi:hypothetical protein